MSVATGEADRGSGETPSKCIAASELRLLKVMGDVDGFLLDRLPMSTRKHVFISHHHRDDAAVDKLTALLKGREIDLRNSSIRALRPENRERFEQRKVSDNTIKRWLRRKVSWATTVIVLIGEHTHSREWVDWEIEQAHRQGKPIIGVFEHGGLDAEVPVGLKKYGCTTVAWNAQSIIDAIEGGTPRFEDSDGNPSAKGAHVTSRC